MIQLGKIDLSFDKPLIKNGEIIIPDNKITAITGKSGCGKTSLLYLIGLISSSNKYNYLFDGHKVNLKSDKEISALRKTKIGYVFQDNSLIDSLSVKDNIKYSAEIAGISVTDEEIKNYLKYVELDVNPDCYPRTLSGGEQQRLAIACAIAKKPDLIIADEPTSALDKENCTLIMNIFKKYVQEKNKKVVIASHNDFVYSQADVIYKIADYSITPVHGKEHIEAVTNDSKTQSKYHSPRFKGSFLYALKTSKRSKFQKAFAILLCAASIACAAGVNSIGNSFVDRQQELLKQISDRQIFLVNATAPTNNIVDIDENISITESQKGEIEEITDIDSWHPYLEFRSSGYDFENNTGFNSCSLNITTNKASYSQLFGEGAENGENNLIIVPYFKEQSFDKQLSKEFETDSDNKIYLSSALANLLKLNSGIDTVRLEFDLGVPVYTTETELFVSGASSTYKADVDVSVLRHFDLEISGILNPDVVNRYSNNGNNIIYMPIEQMLSISQNAQKNLTGNNNNITVEEWMPSAYIIFVKDYNDIKPTIEKLESVHVNFKAVSSYQDIEAMNDMMSNVKHTATWIIAVVLVIVFVLMSIIYINNTINRRYEIAILKANGLNKKEIFKLILSESLIQALIISLIGAVFTVIISVVINTFFGFNIISLSLNTAVLIVFTALCSVIIPTIGSVIVINKTKPDKIMRN